MSLSQKIMDLLLKCINNDNSNQENLEQLIKSINSSNNCRDKNNSNINEELIITNFSKEKKESLLDFLNSINMKNKKCSDLSEEKEELIIVANECTFILLGHLQSKVTKSHDLLYKFINLQLSKAITFWDDTVVSMLNTISKVIREVF